MRCIFCLQDDPPSGFTDEHVFPEAVGGTVVIRSVCKTCNDRLGHSVDVTITDHTLVAMKRAQFGLAGKTGRIPMPFANGVLAEDSTEQVQLRPDPSKPGGTDIYVKPFLKRTMTGPKEGQIQVRIDARDANQLRAMVNKSLVRAGARPLSEEEVDALSREVVRTEQPVVRVPLSLDMSRYRRGLMKIVYELACEWLGDRYVDVPTAVILREFIFDEDLPFDASEKYSVRGTMRIAPRTPFLPFWPNEGDHLRAFMASNGQVATAICVSVLGMMDASIRVTDEIYEGPGRFISIDPANRAKRDSTFDEEVDRLLRRDPGGMAAILDSMDLAAKHDDPNI
ncbi:MAG: HNH endonuclease [Myxococcota bacterium]